MATKAKTSKGWKLAIAIGGGFLIPIRMDKTAREDKIALHEYHKDDLGAGGRKKYCKSCGKDLTDAEIVKGLEAGGQVVTFSKEELESLPLDSTRTIEVSFVEAKEVNPMLYDTSYYLSPAEDMAIKAFNLFAEGLKKLKKVAVGKVAIKQRENLCVIRPVANGGLVLSTLFWNDEIKDPPQVAKTQLSNVELDLIGQLMGKFIQPFNHADYSDKYNDALNQMAQDKLAGKTVTMAKPQQAISQQSLEDVLRAQIDKVSK